MMMPCGDAGTSGVQRFEISTRAGRRRHWPLEVKAMIVAESFSGRETVCAIASRHALSPSPLFDRQADAWRKLAVWRYDYNNVRPYSSLGNRTPVTRHVDGAQVQGQQGPGGATGRAGDGVASRLPCPGAPRPCGWPRSRQPVPQPLWLRAGAKTPVREGGRLRRVRWDRQVVHGGHFPNDEAAPKLFCLILNRPGKEWKMPPRAWNMAKAQFAVLFGERFVRAMTAGKQLGREIELDQHFQNREVGSGLAR